MATTTRKKTTSRKASAKATAAASASLPQGEEIPEGFEQIGGSYAPTWAPEIGDSIVGEVTGNVKEVEMKQGRKVTTRNVVEFTTKDGERLSVWESATLSAMFDQIRQHGPGETYWIRFDGLGKKKAGQNPPKLFTVAKAA